uniref:Uncharacterized protein n=1 Tax=Lepeophtheirus salmonis TaxID=72036 RepID=A0A0K2V6C6_LEPSM
MNITTSEMKKNYLPEQEDLLRWGREMRLWRRRMKSMNLLNKENKLIKLMI